jgi:hypothetical protein
VKKREAALPPPEPELSWPEPPGRKPLAVERSEVERSGAESANRESVDTVPPMARRRRRRRWPLVLLLLLVAGAAVVYLKRDRIPWWTLRARVVAIFHQLGG